MNYKEQGLNRILKLAGVKQINEIDIMPPQPESGIDHDYVDGYGDFVFHVDGFPVYVKRVGDQDLYTAIDGENVVSQIVFNVVNMPQYGEVYIAFRGFTNQEYRGKGLTLKVMIDVRKHTGKTIISDIEITSDGLKTWDKLKKVFRVDIINIKNGEVLPLEGNEDKLFTQDTNQRYTYIIEKAILNRLVESRSICRSYERMRIEASEELMNFEEF